MRGSIAKKGKQWYAVVYDGIDERTGRQRRRWVPAGPRRADAERMLNELIQRKYAGEPVVTEKLTLGEYLTERWLPVQRARLRASTFESLPRPDRASRRAGARNPEVGPPDRGGRRPLLRTSPHRWSDDEERSTSGLAPSTVRTAHALLNKAMGDALRKGTIVRNVVALADAPAQRARKRGEIRAWDADQLATFLDAIRSHRLHPAFHLAAFTGMRRGEVLGLRWCDLDLSAGRLSVRQALVTVSYRTHISDVKTAAGRRTIDLDPGTVDVMKARCMERAEERGGVDAAGDELVFCKPDGSCVHPCTFSQILERKVRQLDVPTISLHDLRHSHATLLLKQGVPVKVVSERLGHSSVAFTMTVYQHVLPGMQAEAAAVFAELLSRRSGAGADKR